MNKTIALVLILVLFVSMNAFSQHDGFCSANAGVSYIAPGYSKLPDYGANYNVKLNIGQRFTDARSWHKNYNFPYISATLFASYNAHEAMGGLLALYPEVSFIIKEKKKFEMRLSGGLGLALFSSIYHPEKNPYNKLIGSHLTAAATGELLFRYKFNTKLSGTLQAGMLHCSNGHIKLPNIGLNMPYVFVGTHYWFNEEPKYQPKGKSSFENAKSKALLRYGVGFHQFGESTKPYGGPVYTNHLITIALAHNYSPVSFLNFGVNFTYYESYYRFMLDQETHSFKTLFYESCMITFFGSHEFLFGRIGLYVEVGLDLYKPFYRKYALFYDNTLSFDETVKSFNSNKLGLQYHLFPHTGSPFDMILGVYIKSNYAQADFIECAVGFAF